MVKINIDCGFRYGLCTRTYTWQVVWYSRIKIGDSDKTFTIREGAQPTLGL